jgi:two-component system, OmpR family, KDP operon response regulator KdpE
MNNEPLVLAVDDEPGVLRLIKLELSTQGLRVITATDGEEGLRMAEQQRPDLIVLDIMMPDISGLEVMRRLRERSSVPIILLTAKDHDQDKVRGLDLGADDYLIKPFNPEELSARVRAILRRGVRTNDGEENIITIGDVEIDLTRRLVKKNGEVVSLTRTEWMLLQQLAANAGKVMLNTELLSKVWGPEYRDDLQYLRVWVSRLRGKLENEPSKPRLIKTLQGIGYLLDYEGHFTAAGENEKDGSGQEAVAAQSEPGR